MFTGIIQERGTVRRLAPAGGVVRLEIAAAATVEGLEVGGSIAVNGACLTATRLSRAGLTVEVIPETLRRTNLGTLRPGSPVNLERAMAVGERLEGHWVQGHVDAVARVLERRSEGPGSERLAIELPGALRGFVVEKGSIAVDGISLTVGEVIEEAFAVYLIPHTLAVTTLGERQPGSLVNLEADILAKYVARLLRAGDSGGDSAVRRLLEGDAAGGSM